ncbi:formate dehydrogenase accessory sulfurtransferase FdhD [soil metagenome]
MSQGASPFAFLSIGPDGAGVAIERMVARECPIALEYNGIGYAVLMATPDDLDDLAYGFSLSERLIERADQITGVEVHDHPKGVLLRIALASECAARVLERVRHRVAEGSCGLCGIENLDQAMRPLARLPDRARPDAGAIFATLGARRGHQSLNALTGAVHAAALCGADGAIRLVREDVGRHNGFDKLIGAMLRAGLAWDGGFALLSSRCSYELVEKAVLAGCPLLATISAPTSLALERAREANLPLVVLARPDAVLEAR